MHTFPCALDKKLYYYHLLHTVARGLFHYQWLQTISDINPAYRMQQDQTPITPPRNRITHDNWTSALPPASHTTYGWPHFRSPGEILIKPQTWFGKEDIATEWEEPRSKIVHALVACYGGRIGYKEACFSLYLFISSPHFVPVFVSLILLFTSI